MSIQRTRPTHYEEYREFFAILASGDRSQYDHARQVLSTSPTTDPSALPARSVQFSLEAVYDSSDDSDDSSVTAVEIVRLDDFKEEVKTVEVTVEEIPRSPAQHDHTSESTQDSEISEIPILPPASHLATPPVHISAASPLAELESSASAVATTNEELRAKLKQILRGLYDIETFRGLVREVLRESENTFRPLEEVKASKATPPVCDDPAKAANNLSPIFKGFGDDKATHTPKKRCLTQPTKGENSGASSEKASFKGAQLLMDVVSDMMSSHRAGPGWKKLKANLAKPWPKAGSAKKRVFTELEE